MLASLQTQAVAGLAVHVAAHANQPARHLALELIPGRQKRRVWSAETWRHAEPLRRADGDIRAEFPGRLQQTQRQRVCREDGERAGRVHLRHERRVVMNAPGRCRVLDEGAEKFAGRRAHAVEFDRVVIADDDFNAERPGAGAHHGDRLRVAFLRNEERRAFPALAARRKAEVHRFRRGRPFVQHGSIGDRQPGEVADHGLEIQQRLQPALCDLRLVGRVGSIPARVFKDVSLDDRRRDRAVIALPNVGPENLVPRGDGSQLR